MAEKWSIAEARRRFSEVVDSTVKEPQAIYRRERLVAALIDAETFAEFMQWREARAESSIADSFADLRALCRKERYRFAWLKRKDRVNPFAPDDAL